MPYNNIQDAIEALQAIYYSDAVRGQEAEMAQLPVIVGLPATGAHTHTRTLIRNGYPVLVAADEQFVQSNSDITFADLASFLNVYLLDVSANDFSQVDRDAMARQLQLINTFLQRNPSGVEAGESNVNIPQLLSRTWSLANMRAARLRSNQSSPLTEYLRVISNNITDAGGCMPGVVARMYATYARLLFNELRYRASIAEQAQQQQVRAPMPVVTEVLVQNRGEEEVLQRTVRPLVVAYRTQQEEQARILEANDEQYTANLLNNANQEEQARALEAFKEQQAANLLNRAKQEEQLRILEAAQASLPEWKRNNLSLNMDEDAQLAMAINASLNMGNGVNLGGLNAERQARLATKNNKN